MKVEQLMSRDVKTCQATEMLNRAAQLMWENDCGCVPVVDEDGRAVGMITDRDVCMAAYTQGRPLDALPVASAMARDLRSCHATDTIVEAESIMRAAQVRRLPVVDPEGTLLGIVSRRDLLTVFLRPDEQIAREVRDILAELLPDQKDGIQVTVHNGLVTLTGHPAATGERDLLPLAVRLAWDVEGVVDVTDRVRENRASAAPVR